ncbi:putative reverse transcriptase domain-containing protein [Tanacetum coccineum]|uniref:Reverse transcriptase domain-containing protein n=1 Tax=Tanacetum coccineum TaxID=301880 RepID=A0ABQ5AFV4_9ASTR
MAPTTRRGPNTPVNNTNPNNMTPESIQAMIDQALLRNSTNGDGSHSSHEDNRRNVQTARPCFYADFMKCQPLNFKGTEGVVGLTRWIEKMESVFNISGCAIENQVKFATCTLKLVANETEKVDKYISGLPDNIYGNVKSARPKTLMIHPETTMVTNSNPSRGRMSPKSTTWGQAKGSSMGDLCPSATSVISTTMARAPSAPKGNGCFECGSPRHFKRDCQKLKNKDRGNGNAQGWVYAAGNAEKRGNAPGNPDANVVTENCYDVELADGKLVEIDTIIRGCTLNFLDHPFNIDLMPIELGSFDVIIGMDWLRRCHAVIVCDEKLVQIPYGNETLTFCGNESSNGRESRMTVISCFLKAKSTWPRECQGLFSTYIPRREETSRQETDKGTYQSSEDFLK